MGYFSVDFTIKIHPKHLQNSSQTPPKHPQKIPPNRPHINPFKGVNGEKAHEAFGFYFVFVLGLLMVSGVRFGQGEVKAGAWGPVGSVCTSFGTPWSLNSLTI